MERWPEPADPEGHWEMPKGELLHLVGQSGDVEAETMAILAGQMVDFEEFPDDVSCFLCRLIMKYTSQLPHGFCNL